MTDKALPDCMAPDGAEPCKAYSELYERVSSLEALVEEAREALQVIKLRSSPGTRTFDQMISDQGMICDYARSALAKLEGKPAMRKAHKGE